MTESASEHTLSLSGYEVIVSTALDDTVHITCPDLPQFSVQGETLGAALALAENIIGVIVAPPRACQRDRDLGRN